MIVEQKELKWFLMKQVLAIVTDRRAQQGISKFGISPIKSPTEAMKIAIEAIFFLFRELRQFCPGVERLKVTVEIHRNPCISVSEGRLRYFKEDR